MLAADKSLNIEDRLALATQRARRFDALALLETFDASPTLREKVILHREEAGEMTRRGPGWSNRHRGSDQATDLARRIAGLVIPTT